MNKLESRLNICNLSYRRKKQACIAKIETPIILTNKGLIPKQSTIDYSGCLLGGKAIFFEAKETKSKTSFALANIKQHQIEYLKFVTQMKAETFFIIHFYNLYMDEAFIVPVELVTQYWDEARENDGRKSIPIDEFNKDWLVPIEDYLKINQ